MQMRAELSDYFYPNYFVLSEKIICRQKERENNFWSSFSGQDTSLSLFYSQAIFVLCNAGQSFSYFQTDSGKSLPPDDEDVKYDLNGTNMGLIWIVTKSKLYEKF